MTCSINLLRLTCEKSVSDSEKRSVFQQFALRGALAYIKREPKCEMDSQDLAKLFEGVLIEGFKDLEDQPLTYKEHTWRPFKMLDNTSTSSESSTRSAKSTKIKATSSAKDEQVKIKTPSPAQSGASSSTSSQPELSKMTRSELTARCKDLGIEESSVKVVDGKKGKPIKTDFIRAIQAWQ